MLCTICKEKPATVHLTQIVGDKMQKLDLCEDCAKTKGINDPTSFGLADLDLVLGLGASQQLEQAAGGVELKCPRCGFTQADFKKSGRLGCPECYRTFAEGLAGLLKTMHKGRLASLRRTVGTEASRGKINLLSTVLKRGRRVYTQRSRDAKIGILGNELIRFSGVICLAL